MKHTLPLLFLLFTTFSSTCFAQEEYPTQDDVHIFWQPDLKITYKDYQGQNTAFVDSMMTEHGFSASASIGIWSVLDVPKSKKDKRTKYEKVYFAPAFERTTSFAKTDDSLQIAMQNLYFDFCEVHARMARRELKAYQDKIPGIGTLSIFYMTVKDKMQKMKSGVFRSYFDDVFIEKKEGAFESWRATVDEALEATKEFATTPEECYRLMTRKPIEKGYIMAPTVIDVLFKEDE